MTATPSGSAASPGSGYDALRGPILGPAYGYALSLTRNRADAEDLVQEAALQGLRGFGTFQPGAMFGSNCSVSIYPPTSGRGSSAPWRGSAASRHDSCDGAGVPPPPIAGPGGRLTSHFR